MGARRWGRGGGKSVRSTAVETRAAACRSAHGGILPSVIVLIGLLVLTGALLAAAPAAHAMPAQTTISSVTGRSFSETCMSAGVDPDGNLFLVDIWNDVIKKVTPDGVVTTVAGSGVMGHADGTGTAASFVYPYGMCYDAVNDCFYIADSQAFTIRKMTRDYVVTTIAGLAGNPGTADGTGTAARFRWNSGIDTDSHGNIYTVDAQAHTVRKITPAGVVTTLAGLANSAGSTDGTGSGARFSEPWGLTVAPDDNVYVCELGNNDVRKITPAGVVTTLAGLAGSPGFADGTGSAARFSQPYGVASDFQGNVFVADYANRRIRKVTPAGVVTTVAGTGSIGYTDGLGSVATFTAPSGLEFRRDGKAYVLDKDRVRLMSGAAEPLPDTQTWTGLGLDGMWSTPANWSTNTAPQSGDSLVFSGATGLAAVNDISGLSIKDVTFASSGFAVSGQPVTLTGALSCAAGSSTTWGLDTTLGGDVAMSMPSGWLTVTGDISLGSTAHTLTVTTTGQVQFDGAVSGGAAGGTGIAKQGTGALKLMNHGSWAGALSVQAGIVFFYDPQALAGGPGVPVSIAPGAAVSSQVGGGVATTWDNVFSGAGTIYLSFGKVTLSGASSEFAGVVSLSDEATVTGELPGAWTVYGTLRGTGTLGDLEQALGYGSQLTPGASDHAVGRLTTNTAVLRSGAYQVDVADADGAAGTGWDEILATGAGGVTFEGTVGIWLRSSNGSAAADAAHFDPERSYRWPIVSAGSGAVSGFSADEVVLNTQGFSNDLKGGRFTIEQSADGRSIDVVFTPAAPPVAGFGNGLACGSGWLSAPNTPSVAFSGASQSTVEMWVRPHSGATNNVTLMRQRDGGAGAEETWLALTKDRQLFAGIQNTGAPGWLFFGFDHTLPLDDWSHVAFVKTSTVLYLYIDGEQVDAQSYGWPFNDGAASAAPLTFGGDALEGNHLPGDLDEVQVYDSALSAEDLQATYNRGLWQQAASTERDPVRYYQLDEGEGTTAKDAGSDGVDATLTDMSASPWIASRAAREFKTDGAAVPVALAYGDADSKALVVSLVEQPAHGAVNITDESRGRGVYTPDDDWAGGSETFTYQVADADHTSAPQTAWVTCAGPGLHTWDGGGSSDDWSDAANWVGDVAPRNGDTVRFDGSTRQVNTDDLLTRVGGIQFASGGWTISGLPLSCSGPITNEAPSGDAEIQQGVTLTADVTVSAGTSGCALRLPDVHLHDASAGHALTLDGAGDVHLGAIDGAGAACTVTKAGAGSGYLAGPGTFGGAVAVNEGALRLLDDGALPSGVPVSIADAAQLRVWSLGGGQTVTLDNPISGDAAATLMVSGDTLRLTGDSPSFVGTIRPELARLRVDGVTAAGVAPVRSEVCGTGVVGGLDLGGTSTLSPGSAEYALGRLRVTGALVLGGDATSRFDIGDATGVAGAGFDTVETSGAGGVDCEATAASRHTIAIRSSDGSAGADAAGFDPTVHQRWTLYKATAGPIQGFAAEKFALDASGFSNDLRGGSFSLDTSADGTSLDLVFTPACPNTHVWTGLSLFSDDWSDRFNWLGGVAPSDGDSLAFFGLLRQDNVNDCLHSVGSVRFWNAGFTITGDPLTMDGTLRNDAGFSGNTWLVPTTAGADLSIQNDCGELDVGGLHLHDGATGHALTVDGGGTTSLRGNIDGAGTDCTLTKLGSGELELRGTNSFGGAVTISEGTVTARGAQTMPAGVPVSIAGGATLEAAAYGKGGGEGTWDNELSGSGSLVVTLKHLRLTGDSPGYTGRVTVDRGVLVLDGDICGGVTLEDAGVLGGDGNADSLVAGDGGTLMPGVVDLAPAALGAEDLNLAQDGSATFAVADADGEAGTGYDVVRSLTATIGATADHPFRVSLLSVAAGEPGPCAGWDPDKGYRWHLFQAMSSLEAFPADAFTLDTSEFAAENDLHGGVFTLEQGTLGKSATIDAVFHPCAVFADGPTMGDGGDSFAKGSEQTVAWTTDVAPPAGSVFKVVADDPASATDVLLATIPATSATEYSCDWTIAQGPSTGWHVTVQLWSDETESATEYHSADSRTFDILAASYTISVAAGDHGDVTPGTGPVTTYSDKTYTITPDEGYHVSDVEVDDVSQGAPTSYEFKDVRRDHTISATFAIDTFTITPSVVGGKDGHGAISPGTTQTVDHGAAPTFTFAPDEGYHIADVAVDGKSVGAVPSVTLENVDADHLIEATFAIDTFTITPSVAGGAAGHGAIGPSGAQTADWHSAPTFTFAPEPGYEVDRVLVDDQPVQMTAANEYTFPAVTADHTIQVVFRIRTFAITVVAGPNGSVTPSTCDVDYDSTPTLAITPDAGYMVADVLVDGASVGAVTSYQFAPVQAVHELSASFVPSGMPYASVSGGTSRWSKRPVTLTFAGHPGEGGIPIAFTEYRVGSAEWARGGSVKVSTQGATTVQYRAVDKAGVVQDPAGSCVVRVDTRTPHVVARSLAANHGGAARLRFKVVDPRPSSSSALMRLVVVSGSGAGKALTRSSTLPVSTNAWHRIRVSTARLAPGTYTVVLRAVDRAGNFQKGVTRVRLTIR